MLGPEKACFSGKVSAILFENSMKGKGCKKLRNGKDKCPTGVTGVGLSINQTPFFVALGLSRVEDRVTLLQGDLTHHAYE